MNTQINDVIAFWFDEKTAEKWFNSSPEFDAKIKTRFEPLWQQAANGELADWQQSPEGCLALCIVLDQFPLNMYRGEPKSFSTEQMAVTITKHALAQGFDKQLAHNQVAFLYMPLMHSENMDDQNLSVACFEKSGLEDNANFAKHHRAIVAEYGRFPHRNKLLGRESSTAELAYLNSENAFTG